MDMAIAIIVAAFLLFAVLRLLPYIYSYRTLHDEIQVVFLGSFPIVRIPFDEIESIKTIEWKRVGVGGLDLRLGNKLFSDGVEIERRTGLFRRIAITPDDPHAFVHQVKKMMRRVCAS